MRRRACVLAPGNVPFKFRLSLFLSAQISVLPVIFVCSFVFPQNNCFEMEFVEDKNMLFST